MQAQITEHLQTAFPRAEHLIVKPGHNESSWSVEICDLAFANAHGLPLPQIEQHQKVYHALQPLMKTIHALSIQTSVPKSSTHDQTISDRIKAIIAQEAIVVFAKGTKQFPMCGFSGTVIETIRHYTPNFAVYNVLEDPELREGIKVFSSWPTIPQVYVRGKFIGGCDIIVNLHETCQLADQLDSARNDTSQV